MVLTRTNTSQKASYTGIVSHSDKHRQLWPCYTHTYTQRRTKKPKFWNWRPGASVSSIKDSFTVISECIELMNALWDFSCHCQLSLWPSIFFFWTLPAPTWALSLKIVLWLCLSKGFVTITIHTHTNLLARLENTEVLCHIFHTFHTSADPFSYKLTSKGKEHVYICRRNDAEHSFVRNLRALLHFLA